MKAPDLAPPSPERIAELRAQCSTDEGAGIIVAYLDLMAARIAHAEAELRHALAFAPKVTRPTAPAPCADCAEAEEQSAMSAVMGMSVPSTCDAHRRVALTVLATDAPQIMRFLESAAAQ